jgi:beta-glucosidase
LIFELEFKQKSFVNNESIEVSVTLKNTGKYSGKEVVQLFVIYSASVTRPVKEKRF